jgi:hypothetical protein
MGIARSLRLIALFQKVLLENNSSAPHLALAQGQRKTNDRKFAFAPHVFGFAYGYCNRDTSALR